MFEINIFALFFRYEQKICVFCGSKITKKVGFFRGKQRYKCHVCGRQFSLRSEISKEEVWHFYSSGKQTYHQLAAHFCCSTKTIQRLLDKEVIIKRDEFSGVAVVVMDTTYFGRGFVVMMFKKTFEKKQTHFCPHRHERTELRF